MHTRDLRTTDASGPPWVRRGATLLLSCPTGLSGPSFIAALVAAGADRGRILADARHLQRLLPGSGGASVTFEPDGRLHAADTGTVNVSAAAAALRVATGSSEVLAERLLCARAHTGPGTPQSGTTRSGVRAAARTIPVSCAVILTAAATGIASLGGTRVQVCGPLPHSAVSGPGPRRLPHWATYPNGSAPGCIITDCGAVLLEQLAVQQPALPPGAVPVAELPGPNSTADLGRLTLWQVPT